MESEFRTANPDHPVLGSVHYLYITCATSALGGYCENLDAVVGCLIHATNDIGNQKDEDPQSELTRWLQEG